jgi:predicted alpha/beta superfamily hydrolase
MKALLRLLAICILVPSFISAQEVPQPALQSPAQQSVPAPTASQPTQPAATQQPPAKPKEPPKFYQPEGPDPTETIAHEHSVTDMLDVVPIKSQIFHNTRMLRIFLPGNYFSPQNRARKYPVLYLQDGQNVFDKATSFSGKEWEADETVDHLVSEFKVRPMFIVGIDNAGEQRTSEYLSYPDPHNPQFQSATPPELEGTKYAEFLIKEVMPFLQKRYRIATGPEFTGIGGSSYGAVVSLTTALNHPGVFGKLLLESPSLWVGDGKLLTEVEKTKLLPQKIYMGVGTRETDNPAVNAEVVKTVTDLEKILRSKGLGPSRLKVVVEEGGQHNEEAWARRFPDALLFLYPR